MTQASKEWSPKSYQSRAIRLMLQQAAVGLFLDPGLGKTSTVLAAFKILKSKGYAKKMLIIAPLRPVYKVWPDEIKKWANFNGLTYAILHGPDKAWNLDCDVDIYIINPEGLEWLFTQKAVKLPKFDVLVIDESTKFKNSTTKRFRALKPFIPTFSRRWILTGTPVPNGLMDLFGQIYILDGGRSLGRFITHYRQRFFVQGGFGGYEWTPAPGSFERVVELISPLILQMNAEEYLEMPELQFLDVEIDLPEAAMARYKDVEDHFITELDGGSIVAASAAAAGTKCRQIANGAVYTGNDREWVPVHETKLDALEDLLEELGGKPVLVLYEFDHDRQRIQERLGDVPCLGSGITTKQMEAYIDGFNAGRIPVLLGHPASMGHGLNLQGSCHHIIWYGITWNLELYDQAIARVYRQGQAASKVLVYHIVARKTLDETVLKVLTSKDKSQQKLLRALHITREEA